MFLMKKLPMLALFRVPFFITMLLWFCTAPKCRFKELYKKICGLSNSFTLVLVVPLLYFSGVYCTSCYFCLNYSNAFWTDLTLYLRYYIIKSFIVQNRTILSLSLHLRFYGFENKRKRNLHWSAHSFIDSQTGVPIFQL